MSVGAPGAHFGRDPDRLDQLLLCRAISQGCFCVTLYAVRALRDVRHGDSDDLLDFSG